MSLTPTQLDCAVFIRDFRCKNGMSPTLQEIAKHFGVSRTQALYRVRVLKRKGVITFDRYLWRSITIINDRELPPRNNVTLPILGEIGTVKSIAAATHAQPLNLCSLFADRHDLASVRVKGDDFSADHTIDGDVVVIATAAKPRKGDRVIAETSRGRFTIARYDASFLRVVGVVVGSVRLPSTGGAA